MIPTQDERTRLRAAIFRIARKLNASSAIDGLSPTQATFLADVVTRSPIGLAELTAYEGLNPTMASRIVATLSHRHLIHRVRNPHDLRSVLLEATPAGHEFQARIVAQRDAVVAEAIGELSAHDREVILQSLPALERLVVAFGWPAALAEPESESESESESKAP